MGVRAGLERGGLTVCAEVSNAEDAVEAALRERPDVCLLDIQMPGSGISAARQITQELEDTVVVMLTVSSGDRELFESLRAGASGYLLKETDIERLPDLVRAAADGNALLPPRLVARLVDEFRRGGRRRYIARPHRPSVELTSREYEVLELLDTGLTPADVANRLLLSKVTVRRHISSAIKKLGVPSRDDAVRLATGVQGTEHSWSAT
jgi:DNA-binding NarL/FixJ family response regulator